MCFDVHDTAFIKHKYSNPKLYLRDHPLPLNYNFFRLDLSRLSLSQDSQERYRFGHGRSDGFFHRQDQLVASDAFPSSQSFQAGLDSSQTSG
jgi:hypothetical protein